MRREQFDGWRLLAAVLLDVTVAEAAGEALPGS
jgi:hypothetical protein